MLAWTGGKRRLLKKGKQQRSGGGSGHHAAAGLAVQHAAATAGPPQQQPAAPMILNRSNVLRGGVGGMMPALALDLSTLRGKAEVAGEVQADAMQQGRQAGVAGRN